MALERVVHIDVGGFSGRLPVVRARGIEKMHEPFAVEVSARALDGGGVPASVDLDALLGSVAKVSIALGDGDERSLYGVIDEIEQRYDEVLLTVVPRVAPLAQAIDHQVFLQKDAVAIAREILDEHGVDVNVCVARSLPPRVQCV